MVTKKARLGWGVLHILGMAYALVGTVFTAVGLMLLWLLPAEVRLVGYIFAPMGLIFLMLGLGFLAGVGLKKRRMDRLLSSGRFVWGWVVDFQCNHAVTVRSRHPYRVVACYTDGRGLRHLFHSQNFFFYGPQNLLDKPVRIYTDGNYRHYYVDVEPLLANYTEIN